MPSSEQMARATSNCVAERISSNTGSFYTRKYWKGVSRRRRRGPCRGRALLVGLFYGQQGRRRAGGQHHGIRIILLIGSIARVPPRSYILLIRTCKKLSCNRNWRLVLCTVRIFKMQSVRVVAIQRWRRIGQVDGNGHEAQNYANRHNLFCMRLIEQDGDHAPELHAMSKVCKVHFDLSVVGLAGYFFFFLTSSIKTLGASPDGVLSGSRS